MGWKKRVLITGLLVSLIFAATGLSRADIARELRARTAEFLALCLIAERAGLDPEEIERIAAPVVSPGKKPAEEMLRLIGDAEAALREASLRLESFVSELEKLARRVPIVLFPQCHIDLVWQWGWGETVEIARETFRAQLELARSVPGYVYCQGQAALYAAVERADPALFREIQAAVREGRWRIVGGNWAEIVMEEVTGESVIRNFLYGKRYFLEKFGVDVEVAWQMEGTGLFPSLPCPRSCGASGSRRRSSGGSGPGPISGGRSPAGGGATEPRSPSSSSTTTASRRTPWSGGPLRQWP